MQTARGAAPALSTPTPFPATPAAPAATAAPHTLTHYPIMRPNGAVVVSYSHPPLPTNKEVVSAVCAAPPTHRATTFQ